MDVRDLRYDGLGQGYGRLRSVGNDVRVPVRGYRRGRLALTSPGDGRVCWSTIPATVSARRLGPARTR